MLAIRLFDSVLGLGLKIASLITCIGYFFGWNSAEAAIVLTLWYISQVMPHTRQFNSIKGDPRTFLNGEV